MCYIYMSQLTLVKCCKLSAYTLRIQKHNAVYIVPCPNMCHVLCVEHTVLTRINDPATVQNEHAANFSYTQMTKSQPTLSLSMLVIRWNKCWNQQAHAPLSSKPIIHHRCTEHVQNNYMRVKQWIKYVTHTA